ncbi:MAG: beta-lactamase family protein [Pseudomonadota bacterium]|nr:beta-lactamase family protein [Pseudomonadota bacterium]
MNAAYRLDSAIDAALGDRIVGCVVLVNENGKQLYSRAAGFIDREAGTRMPVDAIFRYSSLTKPIVATTALRMMDAGLLQINDPVTTHLPWFTPKMPDGSKAKITIKHLLTHTSGLPNTLPPSIGLGMASPDLGGLEENLRRLVAVPLIFAPGTAWDYGRSIDVIGQVCATVNDSDVEGAVAKYVTKPLAMADAHFHVSDIGRLATAYADATPPRRMKDPDTIIGRDGPVTFSPSRILDRNAPQVGGHAMAGTANDMLKLLEVYQPGSNFLKEETRLSALSNQIEGINRAPQDDGKGFGFIGSLVTDCLTAKTPSSNGSTDWGGVYGHSWSVDPHRRITMVMCSNTALEGCLGQFPSEVRDALFQS